MLKEIRWTWKTFQDLTKEELYEILSFRQKIFSVEQESWYLDADGIDQGAFHLLGLFGNSLAAYLRFVKPDIKYPESSLGRVLVHKDHRYKGLGHCLVDEGIAKSKMLFPKTPIRISAQEHLEVFYNQHGFKKKGKPYDEDGILHISMLLE